MILCPFGSNFNFFRGNTFPVTQARRTFQFQGSPPVSVGFEKHRSRVGLASHNRQIVLSHDHMPGGICIDDLRVYTPAPYDTPCINYLDIGLSLRFHYLELPWTHARLKITVLQFTRSQGFHNIRIALQSAIIAIGRQVVGSSIIKVPIAYQPLFLSRQRNIHGSLNLLLSACSIPDAHFVEVACGKVFVVANGSDLHRRIRCRTVVSHIDVLYNQRTVQIKAEQTFRAIDDSGNMMPLVH